MKFFLSLVFAYLLIGSGRAQQTIDTSLRAMITPAGRSFQIESLYLLGKTWGFLKYYHPAIGSGKYNWDNELVTFLPEYLKARSHERRSELLESWIKKFGEVPICDKCSDSLPSNIILRPDYSWINTQYFTPSLVDRLLFIRKNRLQDSPYYFKATSSDGVNFVQLLHEPPYSGLAYPNDPYALLALFRFWNMVEYWYPYKEGLPKSWDEVLKSWIPQVFAIQSGYDYTRTMASLLTTLHDSHGYFRGPYADSLQGKYSMPFTARLVGGQLIVTSLLNDSLAKLSDIQPADLIEKIDGETIPSLVKRLSSLCPASNPGSLSYKLSEWLPKSNQPQAALQIRREGRSYQRRTQNYIPKLFPPVNYRPAWFSFPKDTAFTLLPDSIGYVNVGVFKRTDSLAFRAMTAKAKSLIIDLRQNQDEDHGTGGGDIVAALLMPEKNAFAKFASAQASMPGLFTTSAPSNMGIAGSRSCFQGKVLLLINEQTISVGEFITMACQTALHVKTIGTTTAGADGNVFYLMLPGNLMIQLTGLGVYYPDGRPTQRVGIKPDIFVEPTIRGYLMHKDEQLDTAIDYLRTDR